MTIGRAELFSFDMQSPMSRIQHTSVCVRLGNPHDKRDAPAYEVEDWLENDSNREAVRYVEVESGARFSLKIDLRKKFAWGKFNAVLVQVTMDGKMTKNMVFDKPAYSPRKGFATGYSIEGTWSGKGDGTTYHQWAFGDLETSLAI